MFLEGECWGQPVIPESQTHYRKTLPAVSTSPEKEGQPAVSLSFNKMVRSTPVERYGTSPNAEQKSKKALYRLTTTLSIALCCIYLHSTLQRPSPVAACPIAPLLLLLLLLDGGKIQVQPPPTFSSGLIPLLHPETRSSAIGVPAVQTAS